MNHRLLSFFRKAHNNQRGQILPWIALGMTAMLGMGGMTIDIGHAYVVRAQLQNDANAAALAAAGQVYVTQSQTVNTTTQADAYSGSGGDKNVDANLPTVYTTVTPKCLNSLQPPGATCGTNGAANAIQVKETASVPTWLLGVLGFSNIPVAATATASMGGVSNPWNVAVIVDSTGSMASVDSDCGSLTEFQCALSGIQALLASVNPCPVGVTTCSGSTAKIGVSLFTFPPILTQYNGTTVNSISDEINCGGTPATWKNYSSQPIAAPYILPIPGVALQGTPNATYMKYTTTSSATVPNKTWEATYQVTPFLSDYYLPSSTTTGGLNTSSNLVKAVGYASTSGCLTYTFGIWGTGSGSGFGNTYIASSIYMAQAALAAEASAVSGSKNALIVLSDGQANASYYSENESAYGTANSTNQFAQAYQFPMGPANSEVGPTSTSPSDPVPPYYTPATVSSTYGYNTLGVNGKGLYPDWYDQCQQAIQAGQYATAQGTTVYSVAYGAEDSGCNSGWNVGLTDTTLVATGDNAAFALSGLTPCVTMENIASNLSDFYSDYNQSGSGSSCEDASHTVTSLKDIFVAIASQFTTPRLIPNSST
jgi:Flp pilus assembly protein TadG